MVKASTLVLVASKLIMPHESLIYLETNELGNESVIPSVHPYMFWCVIHKKILNFLVLSFTIFGKNGNFQLLIYKNLDMSWLLGKYRPDSLSVIRQKGESQNGNFLQTKNKACVCVSGGKKCSFFGDSPFCLITNEFWNMKHFM